MNALSSITKIENWKPIWFADNDNSPLFDAVCFSWLLISTMFFLELVDAVMMID